MSVRVLIVSNGALCRNPRVGKEAAALAAAGHDVTVLTVRNHAPSEPVDRALLATAPFRRVCVDLLPGFATPAAIVLLRRLRLKLARDLARRTGRGSIHALGPAGPLLAAARRLPADLTIVHNEIAHWAGAHLLAAGRRIAADFEDWHSEDLLPEDRRGRPLGLLRNIEHTLLHCAAYVSTTSESLVEALHAAHGGRRPHAIANAFPLGPVRRRAAAEDAPPALFWFSQVIGAGRGLEAFVAAWSRTRVPSRLVLLGEDHGGTVARLRAMLPRERAERFSVRGLVPPAGLPQVIAGHDLGLALEDARIRNRDLTITNKILQYLNAGLVVLATPTRGQREVLAPAPAAGHFLELDDPVRTAAQLDTVLADHAALAAGQAAARGLVESRYCWEREAPRLVSLVAAALK